MKQNTAGYVCKTLQQLHATGCMLAQTMEEEGHAAQSVELRRLLNDVRSVGAVIGQDAQNGKSDSAIWINGEMLRDAVWALEQWAETMRESFSDEPSFADFCGALAHAVFVADMIEFRLAWMHSARMAV